MSGGLGWGPNASATPPPPNTMNLEKQHPERARAHYEMLGSPSPQLKFPMTLDEDANQAGGTGVLNY